ncbi:MAG: 16S rRNA (cytosine(1402)-N(4))-methyltransferase [Candidatus Lloydbacteria bacterium RIFCSPHIGHO2_02_FULL_54_17]|uniref:Ribosomal RNA small subunit methyltransferase H n=1 Tax=Candidatus Lloydbacteria bacterium RIFCSPHIGHO2_02_FULL_54_17 TaxID=1798664 RepID=A0A1G2DGB7_9BACT|nr:MAG: 16S rRNA (cytosine(1402)-N(4))-methyltransferase [Candidatus Lloydbacteria bacterium RIFCSPHIGHO2_01_FULL_54_11]OGZ12707.1 MAG: 16S rRNA (cytosine(1402)-N(4))-methyltransferase [Candidatus Lloydbacteria bacterium RIFCSPHIGHO2_02_FULL_54_17]OGZ13558.1 MAG: 16S rRNA (cytosine(1402)-N(4))-methyltransferase [Candidatus Lloydbacteria bacterium RIFCSPLOWO2_01_FULL_54_18]OGZ16226.1 MAG: 16S rRNA (cytosine(1402)-N(4))-methyltransferase [Candidatus Lloydbacteria bacterium RIFCSPLOWO2_02_FULL_54_1
MAHWSVLLHEIIEYLRPEAGDVFVDATFGGGGHSRALAEVVGKKGRLIAFDRDASVFSEATVRELGKRTRFTPLNLNFRDVGEGLERLRIKEIDGAVFDLGLSSTQLEESGRGFSFQRDEPLQMTFKKDPEEGDVTAEIIVNRWEEENIASVLAGFGEERFARLIAKNIVTARKSGPIRSTGELVEVIHQAIPLRYQHGRTHFATRTFQALRMAVNDELGAIDGGVRGIVPLLAPGARIAVISFHSVEDRLVKRLFRELARKDHVVREVTKKPLTPSAAELRENPRARSAKLRVVEKLQPAS